MSGTAALLAAEAAGAGSTADGTPYSGDTVSLTGTATGLYNTKDVATAGTVTFAGLSLAGTASSDYTLTASTQAATITAKTVTASITGNPTKPYDGNTSATLTSGNYSLFGLVDSESFTVTKSSGTYNTKDVGTATTVTASLATGDFTAGVATLASDYSLPSSASGPGYITKADATIVVTPYSVTYDSNAHTATGMATGVGGDGALIGLDLSGTTHTNAGTYNGDAWTFTDVTGNYNDASGTVNDTIAKADASILVNGYSGTYDAAPTAPPSTMPPA